MADLLLVRHGRTAWNESGRFQGQADVALDEVGIMQAKQVASVLAGAEPARLWTSDLARATQTAQRIAEATDLVAEPDRRLREFDVGERTGLTAAEFAARYPERHRSWGLGEDQHLVRGEESIREVRERVEPALREMLEAVSPEQAGIVVAHGACLKVGVLALLGLPSSHYRTLRGMDNCGWTVLTRADSAAPVRLVAYNRTV